MNRSDRAEGDHILKSERQVRTPKERKWGKSAHKSEEPERRTVRTPKGSERARDTYVLGATGQNTEENQVSGDLTN